MRRSLRFAQLILGMALLTQGASAQVAECDALAASPLDTTKPGNVKGVEYDRMDGSLALTACERAVKEAGGDARQKFQLARAIQKAAGDLARARALYLEAAKAGHLLAMNNLATLYANGQGGTNDEVLVHYDTEACANR